MTKRQRVIAEEGGPVFITTSEELRTGVQPPSPPQSEDVNQLMQDEHTTTHRSS